MTRPPVAYRAASFGLVPVLAAYTLARALRDGGWRYARERYGFTDRQPNRPLWIHCASVGEVGAAAPLLIELADVGFGPLLLTTNTPAGYRQASRLLRATAAVAYLPLDRPGPVRRFLSRSRPRAALILETELWPHLFAALSAAGIRILLVNARLSRRTLEAPAWWRATAGWCLHRLTAVLARSPEDAARFVGLGADPDRVEVVGNLKFAAASAAPAVDPGRRFVLAASTHDDEELQLTRAWRAAGRAGHLLAIAPRHPKRGDAIARALAAAGIAVRRRSRDEPVDDDTEVYLVDTIGEVRGLMASADVVFVGGSLIPHGGQNVLEPARAGCATVAGPHMDNFAEEARLLETAGALLRCHDADEAARRIAELLDDDAVRRAMGERGAAAVAADAEIAARYRRRLVELIGATSAPPASM